jgi:hypothetical protein
MVALIALLALARAGEPLTFEAVRVVEQGRDVPRVIFHAHDAGSLEASATCSGKAFRVARSMAASSHAELRFDGLVGEHTCAVHVAFREADGSDAEADFEVQVATLPPFGLSWTDKDHVVGSKAVTLHAPRAVADATVRLFGAKGRELAGGTVDLGDPSTPVIRWDDADGEVVKVLVEAADGHGMRAEAELFPWYYEIPHEDVVFDTASDVVRADQVGRLDTAWQDVVRTLDLYGSVVRMNLYVAGCTDTVGDAAYNLGLSDRRAKAIARWFQAKGFPGGIFYLGLGEGRLAVTTPDETDEVRNRRAVYVLSAQPPSGDLAPRGAWRKL